MCVVSMVMDHWTETVTPKYPAIPTTPTIQPYVSREEFNSLKESVEELVELLKRAKIYDEEHDQPDCEMEEKIAKVREYADFVGIDLDEVFGNDE